MCASYKELNLQLDCCCAAAQDDRQFVSIIGFECRGMDIINWHPEVRSDLFSFRTP
jgi:hypothetical protein